MKPSLRALAPLLGLAMLVDTDGPVAPRREPREPSKTQKRRARKRKNQRKQAQASRRGNRR